MTAEAEAKAGSRSRSRRRAKKMAELFGDEDDMGQSTGLAETPADAATAEAEFRPAISGGQLKKAVEMARDVPPTIPCEVCLVRLSEEQATSLTGRAAPDAPETAAEATNGGEALVATVNATTPTRKRTRGKRGSAKAAAQAALQQSGILSMPGPSAKGRHPRRKRCAQLAVMRNIRCSDVRLSWSGQFALDVHLYWPKSGA